MLDCIKFYKIKSAKCELCYIGSTKHTLKQRLSSHNSKFKQWKNGKKTYCTSFELLKYEDYTIELIKEVDCNPPERDIIEYELIHSNNTVNKFRPDKYFPKEPVKTIVCF